VFLLNLNSFNDDDDTEHYKKEKFRNIERFYDADSITQTQTPVQTAQNQQMRFVVPEQQYVTANYNQNNQNNQNNQINQNNQNNIKYNEKDNTNQDSNIQNTTYIEPVRPSIQAPTASIIPNTNVKVLPDGTNTKNQYLMSDGANLLKYDLDIDQENIKFTKGSIPKKSLQSKDLLPGIVKDSDGYFQSFNNLYNYLDELDLELPEAKLGIDTVGQSKKNASQDLREAPVCPKFNVGPWNNTTIEPDYNIKSLC
jgi:hypothetical protein